MDKRPEKNTGKFLGIPYNWRPLTPERLAEQEGDHRIIVPKRFGWGYTINFAEIKRRLYSKH
jgi:hypothetical protein